MKFYAYFILKKSKGYLKYFRFKIYIYKNFEIDVLKNRNTFPKKNIKIIKNRKIYSILKNNLNTSIPSTIISK